MLTRTLTLHSDSPEQTIDLGKKIGSLLCKGDVLAMQGTLAAGKTTITKGIALSLGIDETITSPTFCLISEYEGKMPLYHFDVYRLEGTEDFINLGCDDMIYGEGVCIIEWSEKIMEELPKNTIIIKLEPDQNDSGKRTITVSNWPYSDIN
ncbi:MAG: tRNA (adenosine(37)-N6)-threonylcarbamoyltransferase complex ATPase subunit type 1 TsaE [Treponema sp.]|nr:tRNA (adenosine(37)-N6)-threonylcarbamoyltransferase complex ATPase subunit type 1 TsaE [Treponema sp.]